MEKVVKIKLNDSKNGIVEKEAIELDILENSDKWSSVKLSDGAELRYQHPILKAYRLKNEYDPEGIPIYVVNHAPILTCSVPDALKKKE